MANKSKEPPVFFSGMSVIRLDIINLYKYNEDLNIYMPLDGRIEIGSHSPLNGDLSSLLSFEDDEAPSILKTIQVTNGFINEGSSDYRALTIQLSDDKITHAIESKSLNISFMYDYTEEGEEELKDSKKKNIFYPLITANDKTSLDDISVTFIENELDEQSESSVIIFDAKIHKMGELGGLKGAKGGLSSVGYRCVTGRIHGGDDGDIKTPRPLTKSNGGDAW